MCSWGLANHKYVQTNCSINTKIKGKTYCFSSEDAKKLFMKNPSANLAKAESSIRASTRAKAKPCLWLVHSNRTRRL